MTESQRQLKIVTFACCSANLADKISTNLQIGSCDLSNRLILLNGYLELLLAYNTTEGVINCITEDQIDEIINKGVSICNVCDCDQ